MQRPPTSESARKARGEDGAGVDDVLEAVRRLVAAPGKPGTASPANGAPRLVLTPENRVPGDAGAAALRPPASQGGGHTASAPSRLSSRLASIIPEDGFHEDQHAEGARLRPARLVPAADATATEATDETPAAAGREELRRIVREVLREELEGEMGARMTRNVRKLIRQELARMLRDGLED